MFRSQKDQYLDPVYYRLVRMLLFALKTLKKENIKPISHLFFNLSIMI